jgi:RNA polymerase sigma-70 factor, ECF subfamily
MSVADSQTTPVAPGELQSGPGREEAQGMSKPGPSFDEFYAGTAARIVRHAYALTGALDDARDIAQETFARAWQRWSSVSACDSPEAWVRRVATNLAVSRWRRARTARLLASRDVGSAKHAPEISTDTVALVAGLRTLPQRQCTVLVLYYLADLPVQEIAAELGCPVGSVKAWLSRGRAALAAAMRADDANPTSEASHA